MRDNPYDLSTGRKGFKAMADERNRDPLDRIPSNRPYRSDIDKANDIAKSDERSEKGLALILAERDQALEERAALRKLLRGLLRDGSIQPQAGARAFEVDEYLKKTSRERDDD